MPEVIRPFVAVARWLVAGLTALSVVLVIGLSWSAQTVDMPKAIRGPVVFELMAPRGRVKDASEFAWEASARGSTFSVEITTDDGTPLHAARVEGYRYRLPADVRAKLVPETDYLWVVKQLDRDGQLIESSPLMRFRIIR